MSQDKSTGAGWKLPVGCLIALATVFATPALMMSAAFTGTPFIVLPAFILPFLYCLGGRRTYLLSLLIQIIGSALLMGSSFMWIVLLSGILPSIVIVRGIGMQKPFGVQMRNGIAVAALGSIAAALIASLIAGGNIVDRLFSLVSNAARSLPAAYQDMMRRSFESIYGASIPADQIASVIDGAIALLLPDSRMRFPAALFGGAILNGVFGVAFGNRYLWKRRLTSDECYLPLREWALPGNMTCGLLLILLVSFILYNFKVKNFESVFVVVLTISEYAFCIQAFGSIARRTSQQTDHRAVRILLYIVLIAAILCGGAFYISIYGCLSAIFGSRGFMMQKMREKANGGSAGNDGSSHADDENDENENHDNRKEN